MKKIWKLLFLVTLGLFTLNSCEDVPEPYPYPTVGGNGNGSTDAGEAIGDGTSENPFNITAVNKFIKEGEGLDKTVYIKGIVSATKEISPTYGNATFYISDDGSTNNQFYIYRCYGLNNKKIKSEDEVKVGDEVIICGKVMNYNNTYETVQNQAYIYSINGKVSDNTGETTGEATGDGTLTNPYNSVAATNYAKSLGSEESPKDVYIKGKVVSVSENYGTQFGNATFTISDDGTSAGEFTVYRALYLGNKKYTEGDQLKPGDEVIVCGKVVNFMGNTPETVQGKAYLHSLNGKTEGGTTPSEPGTATGDGTLTNPYNSVAANEVAEALEIGAETAEIYLKGKVVSVRENYGTQFGNATFYVSDDGKADNQFLVYRALYLNNEKYTSGDLLQPGDDVVVCGKLTKYQNTKTGEIVLETVANGAYLYSLKSNGGGGETPGEGDAGSKENPYTVAYAIANNSGTAWVKGYVVGWVDGMTLSSGATFNGEATSNTNLLIADTPDETELSKCMPVQLPSGSVRNALNLKDNPTLYKKQVFLNGSLERYFGTAGLKSVKEYVK